LFGIRQNKLSNKAPRQGETHLLLKRRDDTESVAKEQLPLGLGLRQASSGDVSRPAGAPSNTTSYSSNNFPIISNALLI
jgi:hypothetical protein